MDFTRKRVLLVDNHDSFVYNLKHLIERASETVYDIDIVLNDEIDFARLSLSDAGIIKLKSIRVEELNRYYSVHFINAI